MSYAIMLPSRHGAVLVNRFDRFQPHAILTSGGFHIDHEIEGLASVLDHIQPGSTVLDCGANVGLIAVPLARHLAQTGGTLHAFEPQRFSFFMLAGNAALSGLVNLHCHRVALGATPGNIDVPVGNPYLAQDFGTLSLVAPQPHQPGPRDRVPVQTIDELSFPSVGLIKVDVEGMEVAVLEGGKETIARDRPFIWIEIWPDHYSHSAAWLSHAGYDLFIFDDLNFLAVPRERIAGLPIMLEPFDGVHNPMFEAARSQSVDPNPDAGRP